MNNRPEKGWELGSNVNYTQALTYSAWTLCRVSLVQLELKYSTLIHSLMWFCFSSWNNAWKPHCHCYSNGSTQSPYANPSNPCQATRRCQSLCASAGSTYKIPAWQCVHVCVCSEEGLFTSICTHINVLSVRVTHRVILRFPIRFCLRVTKFWHECEISQRLKLS